MLSVNQLLRCLYSFINAQFFVPPYLLLFPQLLVPPILRLSAKGLGKCVRYKEGSNSLYRSSVAYIWHTQLWPPPLKHILRYTGDFVIMRVRCTLFHTFSTVLTISGLQGWRISYRRSRSVGPRRTGFHCIGVTAKCCSVNPKWREEIARAKKGEYITCRFPYSTSLFRTAR